jgi:hypothetical protein
MQVKFRFAYIAAIALLFMNRWMRGESAPTTNAGKRHGGGRRGVAARRQRRLHQVHDRPIHRLPLSRRSATRIGSIPGPADLLRPVKQPGRRRLRRTRA